VQCTKGMMCFRSTILFARQDLAVESVAPIDNGQGLEARGHAYLHEAYSKHT
jgi:hypothetical protein